MDKTTFDANDIEVLGMFKNKRKEVSRYKNTSSRLFKITLFFAILFLVDFIVIKAFAIFESDSTIPGSIISLSILLFAVSVIMYFFDYQFSKLEKIVEEVESGEGPIFEDNE